MEITATLFVLAIFIVYIVTAIWLKPKLNAKEPMEVTTLLFSGLLIWMTIFLSGAAINSKWCWSDQQLIHDRVSYIYGENLTGYHWDYPAETIPKSISNPLLFHSNTTNIYREQGNIWCYNQTAGDLSILDGVHQVTTLTAWIYTFYLILALILTWIGMMWKGKE